MPTIENLDIQITASASDAASKIGRLASALSGVRGPSNSAKNGLKATKDETVQAGSKFQKLSKDVAGANKALSEFGKQAENAGNSAKRGSNGLSRFFSMVKRIVLRRNIISVMRSISSAFKEGETNLYNYSKTVSGDFAASMDRLATSTQYLKNSLGALGGAVLEALEPALNTIIDWLVEAINFFNMFVAALSGKSTYTAAVRQSTTWANGMSDALANANEEAQNLKRTILGFDEINKLTDVSSGSGGSGGSGGSSGGAGMFEERQLSGGFQEFSSAFESAISDTLSRITMIVGAAELGLGAILALSGANVGLGLALMASGAVTIASAIIANWDSISPEIKLAIAGIETALGTMLAVGAVIAFSGGNVGLGIGLMIGALSLGGGAVTLAWNTIKEKMKSPVEAVGALIAGIMFGIGAVIAFSGHPGVGIGIMIAATAEGAATINWDYLQEKLQGPIGKITALVSGAELVLGILMIIAGHPGIGLGLIVSGLGTGLLDIAANWDEIKTWFSEMWGKFKSSAEETWEDLKEIGSGIWGKIKEGISSAVSTVGSWIKEHIFKPFISAWNWLFGKSDSNVSNAVVSNADVDASQAEELRKLGREMGKYIKDGLSSKMKSAGNDAWDAVVSGWNGVHDKTLNAELAFTSSDDAWTTFKAGWDTQSHVLEFGAAWSSDSPDGELYSTFIQGWNSSARFLRFNPGWSSDTPVADTYNNFVKSWNAYGRWLRFNPGWTSDTPVADMYNNFVKSWDAYGRWLRFNPGWTSTTPVADMYNNFVKSWNAYAKWLRFNPGWTSATPVRDMYENFVKSWNAAAKWLRFNPGWTSSTPVKDMYENFVKSWNSAAKWLRFNPGWTSTTPVRDMYENFVKSWNSSAKWLKFNPGWTSSNPVADMYNNFVKSWNSSTKWLKFNPGWTSSTPVRDMYENFVKSWNSSAKWLKFNPGWKSDTPAAELYNTVSNVWGQADRVLKFIGNWWDKTPANKLLNGLKDAWNLIKPSKRTLDLYAKAINSADSIWEDFKKAWNNKSRKVTATIEYTTVGGGGSTTGGGAGRTARANGGIITPFGISDFANGGILGHGTLFRAGENGAEVVGHIGGRTEVLNRSQLASTMYYSVRSAMAPLYTYGNSDESMAALAEYIGNAIDSAMAKDRELMRQQNEYLRQINDKEFSAEITTSSINQAQTRMNRRAGTTIVPVGT